MKRIKSIITYVIILTLLFSSISNVAYALEPIDSNAMTDISKNVEHDDFFVSIDLAQEIAVLFVVDMIQTDMACWNENTTITDIVTMYDGSEAHEITAYCIELDKGYVVVSAYIDVPNVILEWSDAALPVYAQFTLSEGDEVVYGGSLLYYKDTGMNYLQTVDGTMIARNEIKNVLDEKYSINNVPEAVLEVLTETASSPMSTPGSSSVITNPINHANTWYGGPFTVNDSENDWDTTNSPLALHTTSDFDDVGNGYDNHCGPTAITNLLIMYGNRYSLSSIRDEDATDIFQTVANIGTSNLYYMNTSALGMGGTLNAAVDDYILDVFDAYGFRSVEVDVTGRYSINYTNIKNGLRSGKVLYLLLDGHDCYGNHHVICYAYTRLVSSTDGSYATYLKVADGWASSPRYIDIESTTGDKYWDIYYSPIIV